MSKEQQSTISAGVTATLLAIWLGAIVTFDAEIPNGEVMREAVALRIDPNFASRDELMLLPGVGPALAERIISVREARIAPAFVGADDLDRVPGIGLMKLEELRGYLRFDGCAARDGDAMMRDENSAETP